MVTHGRIASVTDNNRIISRVTWDDVADGQPIGGRAGDSSAVVEVGSVLLPLIGQWLVATGCDGEAGNGSGQGNLVGGLAGDNWRRDDDLKAGFLTDDWANGIAGND